MKTKEEARAIVNGLKELYPDGICSLQYQKDYELLFSVRLSAQCTDARVNKVTPALFQRFPTLEAFAEAAPGRGGGIHPLLRLLQRQEPRFGGLRPNAAAGLRRQSSPCHGRSVKTPRHRPQDRQPHPGRHLP